MAPFVTAQATLTVDTTMVSKAPSPSSGKASSMSPSSVYSCVSGHIVSLVTSRRRRHSTHDQRVRIDNATVEGSQHDQPAPSPQSVNCSLSPQSRQDTWSYTSDDDASGSGSRGMRAEQSVCLNCRALFFVALVADDQPFCSLDCRTCFGFAASIQRDLDQQLTTQSPFDSWDDADEMMPLRLRYEEDKETVNTSWDSY